MICCAFVSFLLKYFLIFLLFILWQIGCYLGVCCLTSTYLCFSQTSFCYWCLIPLWSDTTFCIISTLLNLLRLGLWLNIWSILQHVLCVLENNAYSDFVMWSILHVCYIQLFYRIVQAFCLFADIQSIVQSIIESEVLKLPTIVELSVSPFNSFSFVCCTLGLCC